MMHLLTKTQIVIITGVLLLALVVAAIVVLALREAEVKYIHQILATGEVGIVEYPVTPPGQSTILEREYPGAPPLVPHSLSGLVVTEEQNSCLTCHAEGFSFGPGHTATKIPESHYIDIPTGTLSQNIQGMRYNCLSCHVPQSPETPPLD